MDWQTYLLWGVLGAFTMCCVAMIWALLKGGK